LSTKGRDKAPEVSRDSLEIIGLKPSNAKTDTHESADAKRQNTERPGKLRVLGDEVKPVEHLLLSE
jgi:hypothetical protein